MSFKKTRMPGRTRFVVEGTASGGWYFNTWLQRRSLKIGKTLQKQDIARCYEAITPRMYQDNLAAREYFMSMEYWPYRGFPLDFGGLVEPTKYEHLILPRTPKKMARGAPKAGRKRTLLSGTRKLKRNDSAVFKEANSKRDTSSLRCESTQNLESNQQRGSEPESQPTAPNRTPLKHVRFDDDSDWIDISDENIPDRYQEEQDEIYLAMDGDEYILL